MPRKVSQECLNMFLEEGFNQAEIGRACNVSRQAINQRIHRKPGVDQFERERRYCGVAYLWSKGFTTRQIAEEVGYRPGTVFHVLRKFNLPKKTFGGSYWREEKEKKKRRKKAMPRKEREEYYSTEKEIQFLEHLGSHASRGNLTPEELLENYIKAAELRKNWRGINKKKVLAKARGLLKKWGRNV